MKKTKSAIQDCLDIQCGLAEREIDENIRALKKLRKNVRNKFQFLILLTVNNGNEVVGKETGRDPDAAVRRAVQKLCRNNPPQNNVYLTIYKIVRGDFTAPLSIYTNYSNSEDCSFEGVYGLRPMVNLFKEVVVGDLVLSYRNHDHARLGSRF